MPVATFVKIALIGDVHANLPALDAVLAHARAQGVTAIWNIGDFLGYGAFPDEVVERLRRVGAVSIIGNYDLKVLKFPKKDRKWRSTKHPLKWLAFKWAYEQLSAESVRYLQSLPKEAVIEASDKEFLLVHASPGSNEEVLEPDTPGERLAELNQVVEEKYGHEFHGIIFGHSHHAFVRQVGDTCFINTGSIGRADDGDPRACYALMEIASGEIKVEHFRVAYDVDRAVTAVRKNGLPEAFAQMLIQAKELDEVLE